MSETASPTYLSPTCRPSKRPRFTAFDVSKTWNKFNGLRTSLINQTLQQPKNKTFYLPLCEIRFTQININMGNNIFTSKMQRNKPFFFTSKMGAHSSSHDSNRQQRLLIYPLKSLIHVLFFYGFVNFCQSWNTGQWRELTNILL